MAPFYLPAFFPKLSGRAHALRYAGEVRRSLARLYAQTRAGRLIQADVFVAYRAQALRALRAAQAFPAPRLPG